MTTPTQIRKISDLKIRYYGDTINGQVIICEPTPKSICEAIQAGHLEQRNYQADLDVMQAEWLTESQKSSDPIATWQRLVTGYHAGRIAHFVVNGWDHPISINANDELTDGTHRVKAAIFKGLIEVEVAILP